jgi:hypothetical protein
MDTLINQIQLLWSQFNMLTALMVFVAYLVIDMLYAHYTFAVTKLQASRAATTGALMYFLLAVGVLNYTNNALYLFPLVFGSWLGTYLTVEFERRKMAKVGVQ